MLLKKILVFNILLVSAMSIFAGEKMKITEDDRRWLIGCMINAAEMSARANMMLGDSRYEHHKADLLYSIAYDRTRLMASSNLLDRCASSSVVHDFRNEVERIDRIRYDIRRMDTDEVQLAFTNIMKFVMLNKFEK